MSYMRHDTYVIGATVNSQEGECEVNIKYELTLAGLGDMVCSIVEGQPQATSFVFTVVRKTHQIPDQDHPKGWSHVDT